MNEEYIQYLNEATNIRLENLIILIKRCETSIEFIRKIVRKIGSFYIIMEKL
jgi:hypothetical protein